MVAVPDDGPRFDVGADPAKLGVAIGAPLYALLVQAVAMRWEY